MLGCGWILLRRDAASLPIPRGISRLEETFRRDGLKRYLDRKEALRAEVERVLARTSPQDPERRAAAQIAVYLFPNLLPETDFERSPSEEIFLPFEHAIENAPGTEQSQRWFEELRANVWNYESPSRTRPALSSAAQQTLRLYRALSDPASPDPGTGSPAFSFRSR
jgi:hypothetical protein